jgi:phosphatidate cytidylyltransferase
MAVRVLSGAVLVALLVVTIWYLPWWATLALATLFAAIGGAELAGLAQRVGADVPASWVAIASSAACLGFGLSEAAYFNEFILGNLFATVMLTVLVAAGALTLGSTLPGPQAFGRPAAVVLGAVYVGAPLGVAAWLREGLGPGTLTWLIVVISLSDSAQYFVGRAFGRRKLSPIVSPGKTVEGAVGGLLAAIVAGAWLAPLILPLPLHDRFMMAGIAGMLALAGMVGDLFESLLKRSAGAKDSSTLIPGHGGVLDRVDAYLLVLPMFYLLLRWL